MTWPDCQSKDWTSYLKQIKERMEKATPGPWCWHDETKMMTGDFRPAGSGGASTVILDWLDERPFGSGPCKLKNDNAQFIISSRTDIEKLVARVEELTEALSIFNFNEEPPTIGKSYWIDEHDLKMVKEVLSKTPDDWKEEL